MEPSAPDPSLCLCTVSAKAVNINSKSHGHVHCPCEVCLGEVVYPTTAWRHIQRVKKARLSNEPGNEHGDCQDCSSSGAETDVTNFSNASESANACAVYSERTCK